MKFVIQKGQPFNAIVSIKTPGSPTPAHVTGVGNFTVSSLQDGSYCMLIESPMTIEDAENGKVRISLTAEETSTLPIKLGLPEDGSRSLQICKATLSVTTEESGQFFANIPEVYVEDDGSSCLAIQ